MNTSSALLQDMISHWLSTPAGTYLGSDYGNISRRFLQAPQGMAQALADELVDKLKADLPILNSLPNQDISVSALHMDTQKTRYFLTIKNQDFEISA